MKKAGVFIIIAVLSMVPFVMAQTDSNSRTIQEKEAAVSAYQPADRLNTSRNNVGLILNDLKVADIHTDEKSSLESLYKDVLQEEQAVKLNEVEYGGKKRTNPIPEPFTMMLFGFGLLTLGWIIRRHNHFSDR